jgi:hypothetical protein
MAVCDLHHGGDGVGGIRDLTATAAACLGRSATRGERRRSCVRHALPASGWRTGSQHQVLESATAEKTSVRCRAERRDTAWCGRAHCSRRGCAWRTEEECCGLFQRWRRRDLSRAAVLMFQRAWGFRTTKHFLCPCSKVGLADPQFTVRQADDTSQSFVARSEYGCLAVSAILESPGLHGTRLHGGQPCPAVVLL